MAKVERILKTIALTAVGGAMALAVANIGVAIWLGWRVAR
jgi:hypothetical protein